VIVKVNIFNATSGDQTQFLVSFQKYPRIIKLTDPKYKSNVRFPEVKS